MMIRSRLAAFVVVSTLIVSACGGQDLPVVDLSQGSPLPAVAEGDVEPLRVAVAAILSPESSFAAYSEVGDYLSEQIDRPVELVQRRTYEEINDLVRSGDADVAFVCTAAYVLGHERFGMELLAAPEIGSSTTYRATLIVGVASTADDISDLAGAVFAFTDPWSMTGRVYPTYLVRELGSSTEDFFARTFFTYSHDRAIEAVADGVADAASVDSLVLDAALKQDPELAARIRVIDQSPEFGIPPVVVSPSTPPTQRRLVADALLGMVDDGDGRDVLGSLGFDRFVPIEDQAYDDVRQVLERSGLDL